MQSEVLDYLIHRVQSADGVALDVVCREEVGLTDASHYRCRILQRSGDRLQQLSCGYHLPLREFSWAIALVLAMIEWGNQPLIHVSIQVQDQVADAVARFIRTPPHLLIAERFHTSAKTRPVLVQQLPAGKLDECSGQAFQWHGRIIAFGSPQDFMIVSQG